MLIIRPHHVCLYPLVRHVTLVQVENHKLSGKPDEMLYCNPGWGNILSIEGGKLLL